MKFAFTFCLYFVFRIYSFAQEPDTSRYIVMPYNTPEAFYNQKMLPATLNNDDIKLIFKLLKKCMSDYNKETLDSKYYKETMAEHPDLNRSIFFIDTNYSHCLQIVPATNVNGCKTAWVNSFCGNKIAEDDRKFIVQVADGGPCFFSFYVDFKNQEYYSLRVEGYE